MFENSVLRRIFGPKRDEVTGGWRKLLNEELHNLYVSPYIISMIKFRAMRLEGLVVCMEEEECMQGFGWKAKKKGGTRKT
jgi:hypothetical protein